MSGQILITFDELKHLEIEDISLCIDKYQALQICEKNTTGEQAGEIYNVWVRKLFKAYDISEFNHQDWLQILGYIENNILDKFIRHVSTSISDSTLTQLNQWWMDTLELLKWLESIIEDLDVRILCLILTLGFEIIIKTYKVTDKRNMQPIIKIQRHLLHLLTNNMLKMDLQNADDFKGLDKVLTSLCDVGSIISSSDVKLSIETWRVVAKVTGKCNESYNKIDKECKDLINDLRSNWTEKPTIGIIKELSKLFKYILEDTALNNDNCLKVAQFYLKLLKIVLNNTPTFTVPTPAIQEYFEAYTIFMHHIKKRTTSKIIDFIQTDVNEILAFIHKQTSVENFLCQHLLEDNKEFVSCDLVLEYLRICFEKELLPDVRSSSRIFDILFDGPLIFVDSDKYPKVLLYYASLTVGDVTGELHMFWCKNVIESSWLKAYASCEILRIYYGFLFKSSDEKANSCLEFWTNCWQKFNVYSTTTTFNHQRFLVQMIIKSIVMLLPQNIIEKCFDTCPNADIILLKCGKDDVKLLCYLNTNLTDKLKKINEKKLVRKEYTELLNLLDIWCCHQKFVNHCALQDDLLQAFLKIFSLPVLELRKFRDFLHKCLCIFKNLNNIQTGNTILKCLSDNLNKTKALMGVFLLDYLLNLRPQSEPLLKSLQTPEVLKLQNFLASNAAASATKDLHIFQDIYNKSMLAINPYVPASKRPRVGSDCYFSDYKFILNEMFEHSQKLVNTMTTVFDNQDYELLNCIKHNIDKCLIK